MKCLLLFGLFCFTTVSAAVFETEDVITPDELEGPLYGLDDTLPDLDLERIESEEDEEEPLTIPPQVPWSRDRERYGPRRHHRHEGGHHRGRHGGSGHHRGRHEGHHGRHHRRPHHSGERGSGWTEEEKLNHICSFINSPDHQSPLNLMMKFSRNSRLSPEISDRRREVMQTRKAAMRECCQQTGTDRMQCAENVRNQRNEMVCAGEEPFCPWPVFSSDSSNAADIEAAVDRCCASDGQDRITCFREERGNWCRHY